MLFLVLGEVPQVPEQERLYYSKKLKFENLFLLLKMYHICILGVGLELASNGGSVAGEISLSRDELRLHLETLPALASVAS